MQLQKAKWTLCVCRIVVFSVLVAACGKHEASTVPEPDADDVEAKVYQWADAVLIPSGDGALDSIENFFRLSEAKQDYRGMYAATAARGRYYNYRNRFAETVKSIEDRLLIAAAAQDSALQMEALYAAGKFYFDKGMFFESLDYFFRLTGLPGLSPEKTATIYYALGQTYGQIHADSDSLQSYYYGLAEEIAARPGFNRPVLTGFILFGKAGLYMVMDDAHLFHSGSLSPAQADSLQTAITLFIQAEQYFQGINPTNFYSLAVCHALLGDYGKAHEFVAMANESPPNVYCYIKGIISYREKKFHEAVIYGLEGLKAAQDAGMQSVAAWNSGLLNHVYEALGDYRKALLYAETRQKIEENMRQSEKRQQMLAYQVKHDTLIKERELQEEKARNILYSRYLQVISGSAILLTLFLGLCLYLYRNKQKAYRELVRKNIQWAGQPHNMHPVSNSAANQQTDTTCQPSRHNGDVHPDETFCQQKEDIQEVQILMQLIYDVIKEKNLYNDPDLTVESLAHHVKSNKTYVSRAINRITGTNFRTFINEYRIKETIRIISHPAYNGESFEVIAEKCGFNDRISFYRAFKKYTGLTPSDFKKNLD